MAHHKYVSRHNRFFHVLLKIIKYFSVSIQETESCVRIALCFGALQFLSPFTDISSQMFTHLTKPASNVAQRRINTTMGQKVEAVVHVLSSPP
jgi:hypothetical protein